jgi:hypothetical protein
MSRGTQVNLFGVGYGNAEKSLNVTASSRVNLYYDIQPAPGDKSQIAVFNTPGLLVQSGFWGANASPAASSLCQGLYATSPAGSVYGVYNNKLYYAGNSESNEPVLAALSGINSYDFASDQESVIIASGDNLYKTDGTTTSEIEWDVGGFQWNIPATSVTFMDGYYIAGLKGSVSLGYPAGVYISALYDRDTWNVLDYAVPEYRRGPIVKVYACAGLLYVFCSRSTEVWQNVGDPNYPFQRIQGAQSDYGLYSKETIVKINNAFIGLFYDSNMSLSFCSVSGYQFSNITPPDLQYEINDATTLTAISAIYSWTFSFGGHDFYVATVERVGGSTRTYCYDMLSGTWGLLKSGSASYHYGRFAVNGFSNKTYVSDARATTKVFALSTSEYSDDGTANKRELIGNHIFLPDRSTFTMRSMSLDMEQGTNTGPLTVYLSISRDGGHTFGEEYSDTSTLGSWSRFFQFNRLGRGRDIVPKIRTQDPCKFVLIGAVADIAPYGW